MESELNGRIADSRYRENFNKKRINWRAGSTSWWTETFSNRDFKWTRATSKRNENSVNFRYKVYLQYIYGGLGRPLSTRPCLVGHLRYFAGSHRCRGFCKNTRERHLLYARVNFMCVFVLDISEMFYYSVCESSQSSRVENVQWEICNERKLFPCNKWYINKISFQK